MAYIRPQTRSGSMSELGPNSEVSKLARHVRCNSRASVPSLDALPPMATCLHFHARTTTAASPEKRQPSSYPTARMTSASRDWLPVGAHLIADEGRQVSDDPVAV